MAQCSRKRNKGSERQLRLDVNNRLEDLEWDNIEEFYREFENNDFIAENEEMNQNDCQSSYAHVPNAEEMEILHTENDYLTASESEDDEMLSESYDEDGNIGIEEFLRSWGVRFHINHNALSSLLKGLNKYFSDLPLDARTLLKTPRTNHIKEFGGGEFHYFGLKKQIEKFATARLQKLNAGTFQCLTLQINVDGIPLFKSSKAQFWPILCLIEEFRPVLKPFPVAVFCGGSKPEPVEEFLNDFIYDAKDVLANGITVGDHSIPVNIKCFVCDAPARSFLKKIKGHTGYSSCEKCEEYGEWFENRITFPEMQSPLRTDQSFIEKRDEDHHRGISKLEELPGIGLVTKFPVEYMHSTCLGVMRKLLFTLTSGSLKTRLSSAAVNKISDRLESLQKYFPSEFARKPRNLKEMERFKATEWREILLYAGPVVFYGCVPEEVYHNFMLLHCGIFILTSRKLQPLLCDYAGKLLKLFVTHAAQIYGQKFLIYNVHNVGLHLAEDSKLFGPLDDFSAFTFENMNGILKNMLRSPHRPLQQLVNRYSEEMQAGISGESVGEAISDVELKQQHSCGPIPLEFPVNVLQFRKLITPKFVLGIYDANSFCLVGDDNIVVKVKNIVQSNGCIFIIGNSFKDYDNFYTYPCNSKELGVYRVSRQNVQLHHWRLDEVHGKCVVLPFGADNSFVSFPFLHLM